jgi:hypothetical protein
MEQYDHHTFEDAKAGPSIKAIKNRLRKLGCTKEQVQRHMDQVALTRTAPAEERRKKPRPKGLDWLQA